MREFIYERRFVTWSIIFTRVFIYVFLASAIFFLISYFPLFSFSFIKVRNSKLVRFLINEIYIFHLQRINKTVYYNRASFIYVSYFT